MSASGKEGSASLTLLADSIRRFCRSIELCDDYIRGYYGLKLVRPFSFLFVYHKTLPD